MANDETRRTAPDEEDAADVPTDRTADRTAADDAAGAGPSATDEDVGLSVDAILGAGDEADPDDGSGPSDPSDPLEDTALAGAPEPDEAGDAERTMTAEERLDRAAAEAEAEAEADTADGTTADADAEAADAAATGEPPAELADQAGFGLGLLVVGAAVAALSLLAMAWFFLGARTSFVPVLGVRVATWVVLALPAILGIVAAAIGQAMRPPPPLRPRRRSTVGPTGWEGPLPGEVPMARNPDEFEAAIARMFRLGTGWRAGQVLGIVLLVGGLFAWWWYGVQTATQAFILDVSGVDIGSTVVFAALAVLGLVLVVAAQAVKAGRSRMRDRVLLTYQDLEIERLRGGHE